MADNKIVHRVSLEGADKVAKQLQSIGLEGENAFKKVKQSAESSSIGKGGGEEFGGRKLEESREAAERFREVLHTLHPVLGAAGLEIANLGAYGRLAGAGLGFLGAAIVGSVLIGLAKLGDEADKAKRRLDLLSGAGKGGGESQFEGLQKTARELGVDSSDLAPAAETLFRSQQNSRSAERTVIHPDNFVPGPNEEAANRVQVFNGSQATPSAGLSSETINTAIKATAEAGKLDRTSPKDSAAALVNLYESTKGGKGQVTVDAYDAIVKASPAIGDAIAKAASGSAAGGVGQALPAGAPDLRAFLQRGGKLTGDQVLTGLARTEPQLREKAEAVSPGVTESFEHLEAAAKRVAEAFAGDGGIAGAVEKVAKVIDAAADNIDKSLLHPRDYEPGGPKFIGPVSPAENKEYSKPDILDIGKTLLTGEADQRFKDSNAIKAAKFLRDGPAALQKTPQEVVGPAVDFLQKYPAAPQTIEGNTTPAPKRPDSVRNGEPLASTAPFANSPVLQQLHQRELEQQRIREPQPAPVPPPPVESAAPTIQPVVPPEAVTKPVEKTVEERPAVAPKSPEVGRPGFFDGGPFSKNPNDTFDDRNTRRHGHPVVPEVSGGGISDGGPFSKNPNDVFDDRRTRHRSDAGDVAPQPQQVADLSSIVRDILISVTAAANNVKGPQDNKVTGPVDAVGIRGEAAPAADDTAKKQVADLGAAAEDAAAKLRTVQTPTADQAPAAVTAAPEVAHAAEGGSIVRMAEGGRLDVSPGGHLHGPGTGKSDSIDAKVANGEFVVNAKDTAKNIELLHDINSGKDVGHYADGGEVQKPAAKPDAKPNSPDLKGDFSVVYDPNTGGAYINGALHVPGDPILSVPEIAQAIARSKADTNEKPTNKKQKKHSDFVGTFGGNIGGFAEGGIVGRFAEGGTVSRGSNASTFAARIGAMGLSSIDVPHFAVGGMPDIPSPDLNKADLHPANSKGSSSLDLQHYGTVNLQTDHGDHRVITHEDTMKHLNRASIEAQTYSTGKRPGWYGGP